MRATNLKVFSAPSRYVQGRDATLELAAELKALGITGSVGIISGRSAKKALSPIWKKVFQEAHIKYSVVDFQGESSRQEVDRLVNFFRTEKVDAIIGAGGGKTLDTSRAVAEMLSLPVIICPSSVSNDSPCFALSVMYTPSGEYEGIWYMKKNPLLVLVDTTMVAHGPERCFVAGMGDALATYIEAKACIASGAKNLAGGYQSLASEALAKCCFDTILENGRDALDAIRTGSITPALEKVTEANALLSGVGCECTGVAAAHAIHNGLTTLKETHAYMHGEKVAFGLVTQLVLEGASTELTDKIVSFLIDVGLPVTLAEVGLSNPSDQDLLKIAKRENHEGGLFRNEPFIVTDQMIVDAIKAADALGRRYHEKRDQLDHHSTTKWRKSA